MITEATSVEFVENTSDERYFITYLNLFSNLAHNNSVDHGFWRAAEGCDEVIWKLSRFNLMHEEIGEATTGVRKGLMDDHLPHRTMEVCELADTIIRIMDYAGAYNLPLGQVIVEKMAYNKGRPYMHGDKKA